MRLGGETADQRLLHRRRGPGRRPDGDQGGTSLNAQARRDPARPATVRLGYLDGAVHEGTAHVPSEADLVRRVDTAARYNPGGGSLGAAFERAFGKGYAAGEATG